MNAKRAKQLRRAAEEITVGVPQVSKVLGLNGRAIINNPASGRGVYRDMKRVARRM